MHSNKGTLKNHQVGNVYFHLHEGCRLIKGVSRGAIYDLVGKKIYSVDVKLIEILEKTSNVDKIVEFAKENGISKKEILGQINTLEHLGLGFFHVNEIYRSIVKAESEIRFDKKRLFTLTCRIENRCNIRCHHCFSKKSWITNWLCFRSEVNGKEMKVSEWEKLILEAHRIGCENIVIIGGEPFLSDGINNILMTLEKVRFNNILIFTNGTILEKDWLPFLSKTNATILVAIHSSQAKIHDGITRVNGSHARAIRNIEILKKANIDVRGYTIVREANKSTIKETMDYVNDDLGIRHYIDYFCLDGLDYDKIKKNANYLIKRFPRIKEIDLERFAARYIGNACWLNKLAVDINGDVLPCIKAKEFCLGNIRDTSLNKIIFDDKVNDYWYLKKDVIEECSKCEFRYACDDCRLNAYRLTHKLNTKYPFCTYDPLTGDWDKPLPVFDEKRRENQ